MNKGFTLIEILIVITITGILSTIGYVNYRDFGKKQAVTVSRRQILSDLKYAEELALSGNKPERSECDFPETLVSVDFLVLGESQYEIETVCSGGSVVRKSASVGQAVISGPNPNPISFYPLGKGTNISGSTTLGVCYSGKGAGVTISSSGSVSEISYSCL